MTDEMRSETGPIGEAEHERLCAYLFGELQGDAREAFQEELAGSSALQAELERMRSTVELVKDAVPATEAALSAENIERMIEARSKGSEGSSASDVILPLPAARSRFRLLPNRTATRVAAGFALFLGGGLLLYSYLVPPIAPADSSPFTYSTFGANEVARETSKSLDSLASGATNRGVPASPPPRVEGKKDKTAVPATPAGPASPGPQAFDSKTSSGAIGIGGGAGGHEGGVSRTLRFAGRAGSAAPQELRRSRGAGDSSAIGWLARGQNETPSEGKSSLARGFVVQSDNDGYSSKLDGEELEALRGLGYLGVEAKGEAARSTSSRLDALTHRLLLGCRLQSAETPRAMFYRCWGEHPFVSVTQEDHLSTFSVDVDTASYVQARHALLAGRMPAPASVRTEEFVNYFSPDKDPPAGGDTFALDLEMAPGRFSEESRTNLLRVTLRGKDVEEYERKPLALTFVVDVSGSMRQQDRLVNVKEALSLLVRKLGAGDSIALVAFSKEAQVASPMISASSRGSLENALYQLTPGGGTNVEVGLQAGFQLAADSLQPGAVNRVIFLSDGVGNIGETDQARILASVEEYRGKKVYLNTIGVGLESHNDNFLEQLADRGDGVCNYIDTLDEAKKVMVDDFTKTLQTIARDVKIQVEFDPSQVESYRQLGYENRSLRDDQFRDDSVDAGEVNAGHQVTALYEVIPRAGFEGNFITARVRFKPPYAVDRGQTSQRAAEDSEKALEIEARLGWSQIAPSFAAASFGYRRAVLVAQFAELLRGGFHVRGESIDDLLAETERLAGQAAAGGEVAFELDELLGLMRRARPHLKQAEEAFADRPAWQGLVDEVRKLNYRVAQRELLETGTEEERALDEEQRKDLKNRLRELLRESAARDGAGLEAELEAYLSKGGDVHASTRSQLQAIGYAGDPFDEEPTERLKALGYTDR